MVCFLLTAALSYQRPSRTCVPRAVCVEPSVRAVCISLSAVLAHVRVYMHMAIVLMLAPRSHMTILFVVRATCVLSSCS